MHHFVDIGVLLRHGTLHMSTLSCLKLTVGVFCQSLNIGILIPEVLAESGEKYCPEDGECNG